MQCPPSFDLVFGLDRQVEQQKTKGGHVIKPGTRVKRFCKIEGGVLAQQLSQAAKNKKRVRDIKFDAWDSDTLAESDLDWIASWLPTNSHVKLLKLSYIPLSGVFDSMATAIAKNTAITEVHLSFCSFSPQDGLMLANLIKSNSTITKLMLANNNLEEEGGRAILDAFRVVVPEPTGDGSDAHDVLEAPESGNTTITSLNLSGNNLNGSLGTELAGIVDSAVEVLNLSQNRLGDATVVALAKALMGRGAIKNLNIADNNLGDTAATALADMLRINPTITHLNLERNANMTDEKAAELRAEFRGDPANLRIQ